MPTQQSSWLKGLIRDVGNAVVQTVNQQRLQAPNPLKGYIQMVLPAKMPAVPSPRSFLQSRLFGRGGMSLLEFEQALRRIADAPQVAGVLFVMNEIALAPAELTTLRDGIARLRARGKRAIAYAQSYSNATYYLASACDAIWLQKGGVLMTNGLLSQRLYLKSALDTLGIAFDTVAISPYKSATDRLMRDTPSPESEAQENWLMDSTYDTLIQGIAEGRKLSLDATHTFVNTAPHTDQEALAGGYVDALCNEEDFSRFLDGAPLTMWEEATNRLPLRIAIAPEKVIAILPMSGTIYNGKSSEPPVDVPIPLVGGDRIGDVTVVQQIRQLMNDDKVKAVVLYIDSPGGSATASEAIASALDELAKKLPVVACMGGVAASGGYYIASSADYIIAQPMTITGSIGVITAKLTNSDMLKKLRLNPFYVMRGQNADMFAPISPFTEAQREKMVRFIESIYALFVTRVAAARKMKPEAVDAIGGGRVWTGAQAHEHGLIDAFGGLYEAVQKAREMAQLPDDTPAMIARAPQRTPLVAQLANKLNPAAAVSYWHGNLSELTKGQALFLMPDVWRF
jgi:protease-4